MIQKNINLASIYNNEMKRTSDDIRAWLTIRPEIVNREEITMIDSSKLNTEEATHVVVINKDGSYSVVSGSTSAVDKLTALAVADQAITEEIRNFDLALL